VMPTKVQNYILITYEDLLYKYDDTLNAIKYLFGLQPLYPEYVKIPNHTIDGTIFTGERELDFAPSIIQYIWDNVDKQQERLIGYECPIIITASGNNKPIIKPLQKPPPPQTKPPPPQHPPPKTFKLGLPTATAQPAPAPSIIAPIINNLSLSTQLPELKPETIKKAKPASLSGILQNTTLRQAPPHKPPAPTFGIGIGKRMNNGRIV